MKGTLGVHTFLVLIKQKYESCQKMKQLNEFNLDIHPPSSGAFSSANQPFPTAFPQPLNIWMQKILNDYSLFNFIFELVITLETHSTDRPMQKSSSNKASTSKNKTNSLKKTQIESHKQQENLTQTDNQPYPTQNDKSQNVRVAIRIRPMNESQQTRNDTPCLNAQNQNTLSILQKGSQKSYQFNTVLGPNDNQQKCYQRCNVDELIDAAIEGYSATVFAYGQTGSGKTYTMAGKEEIFAREVYKQDEREGIIPRAIQQLWRKIKQKKSNYSIKASFTEIYNQQIKDLLNLSSGVLHCRWNPTNGFFVEDLIVVDCSTVDDMISVLVEGMRNRKSGSHQMNKDSSRSHSILTIYIISEQKQGTQNVKRYGKISFVDLAGSERLKQSKSQGEMIKQTGNINKSLFTLGKVIKGLTDKKTKTPYIPYRDSKLTMLLMDSLGGNSKALMIACASPSSIYYDETLSTLNYAARTMNIRNKPMIQMDQKDQAIQQIQGEIQELKRQNLYLRQQYQRLNKGLPIRIPQLSKQDMIKTSKMEISHSTQLPPIDKQLYSAKGQPHMKKASSNFPKSGTSTDNIISEYQLRFEQIKKENELMRNHKDEAEENYKKMMETNNTIQGKLQNLEQIFLNKRKDGNGQDQIVTSSLLTENTELKRKLRQMQQQKREVGYQKSAKTVGNTNLTRAQNDQLQKQIQRMQMRERQLLQQLQRKKG